MEAKDIALLIFMILLNVIVLIPEYKLIRMYLKQRSIIGLICVIVFVIMNLLCLWAYIVKKVIV
jgi:hypothetical protein